MLYFPSLSVLAVDFAPWSLVAWMVKPTHGFALMSIICPLIVPVWAAARGADANASAATRMAVSTTGLLKMFMLQSPFRRGSWPGIPGPFSPHYRSCPRRIPSLPAPRKGASFLPISYLGGLSAPQKPLVGTESDRRLPLRQKRASAIGNYRKRRKPSLRLDSRTT